MHLRAPRLAALASVGLASATLSLGTAVPAHAATTAAPPSPSPTAAACDKGPWQRLVQGSPGVKAGDPSGDYLWHDATGFHLRVTHHRADRRVYTGTITASAPMRYTAVKLEKGDFVKLSADRRRLSFAFVNYGHIDGADFHTDCASHLTVRRLFVGNRNLPRTQIFLGAERRHPGHVPFTVHRIV